MSSFFIFVHPAGVGVVLVGTDVASDLALPVYGDPEMRWEAYA